MDPKTAVSLAEIYKPIAEDIKRVDGRLRGIVEEALDPFPREFGAFRSMGKRLRPAITLLVNHACRAARAETPQDVIEQAAAIELMHIATLIHDDVVDGAYQRRGHQTLHELFTDKTAVLVGDYLYATAIDIFNRFGSHHTVQVVTRTTVGMAHGELMQVLMSPETRSRREIYMEIISKKTADFFAACAEVGAEAARVPVERRQVFRKFGWQFGVAFQMIDDILDYTASENHLGKPVFQDLAEGKMTLPAILLMESGAAPDIGDLAAHHNLSPQARATLTDHLNQNDIIPRSLREADTFLAEARDLLTAQRDPESGPAIASLQAICDFVLQQEGLPKPCLT
ncbi:MAG: hypothetical protein A3G34_10240 [Candidatus Lindowbacteria bacterium RIFCSPLOWO2_12_FULL_62_27]|nr:MAG: hypothetical protein A3G34_10240 [Candidatus Lindowbacteria bacterium RIFCSPLOWO2_12_FULL_62_27]OGH61617.1 MAG: hypothetical protein A3I06_03250 [Candidatus Lindowbacteria bacterium RIFCSPLOWO2_02_FULL_62_12]